MEENLNSLSLFKMSKKLIDTDIKLGKGTLVLEALEDLGIDFPIEWGENSNGRWEKWNSGKLVQFGFSNITTGTTQDYGVLFRSETTTRITFPIEFFKLENILVSNNGPGAFDNVIQWTEEDGFGIRLVHVYRQSVDTNIAWEAVGRWK